MQNLTYRMYFLVLYSLSGIQKGIQAGHSALEYARMFSHREDYKEFIENNKTWIILDGGTSNPNNGTLNHSYNMLRNYGADVACFCEPDLSNALTSVCFLADNRVWDFDACPKFDISSVSQEELSYYVKLLGGTTNLVKRIAISDKRLAI